MIDPVSSPSYAACHVPSCSTFLSSSFFSTMVQCVHSRLAPRQTSGGGATLCHVSCNISAHDEKKKNQTTQRHRLARVLAGESDNNATAQAIKNAPCLTRRTAHSGDQPSLTSDLLVLWLRGVLVTLTIFEAEFPIAQVALATRHLGHHQFTIPPLVFFCLAENGCTHGTCFRPDNCVRSIWKRLAEPHPGANEKKMKKKLFRLR